MTSSEFRKLSATQENAKPAYGTPIPPAAVRSPGVKLAVGRETAKEQPGPRANTPLRWQVAGPLHAEQFPGEFAVRVTGPLPMLPALVEALEVLVRLAKAQFIDPNKPLQQWTLPSSEQQHPI